MPCTRSAPVPPQTAGPKRRDDIIDIIPCFFDLQVQAVLKLLQISSHTLKRIRQELQLDRWPFEKISRGKSVMWGGEAMGWDEIQKFRARTIPTVPHEMQEILHACERKGVLMRALYLPGYARCMQATALVEQREAERIQAFREALPGPALADPEQIQAFREGTPSAALEEPEAIPARGFPPAPLEGPAFSEADRALLEEIGLLEFTEIHPGGLIYYPQPEEELPVYEGWPASMEEDAYWADVGRHLFESWDDRV